MYIFGAGSSIIWCLRFGDKQKGAISYGKHTNVGHKDEGWRAKDEIRCLIRTKDEGWYPWPDKERPWTYIRLPVTTKEAAAAAARRLFL